MEYYDKLVIWISVACGGGRFSPDQVSQLFVAENVFLVDQFIIDYIYKICVWLTGR